MVSLCSGDNFVCDIRESVVYIMWTIMDRTYLAVQSSVVIIMITYCNLREMHFSTQCI
jgi:hypothetical protein